MHTNLNLIVIGGGPAGCAAATCAARCKWKVIIIDKALDGGHLGSLNNVSYFPGFPEAISGKDLLRKMRRQAELVGVQFLIDTVRAVSVKSQPYKVMTDTNKELEAQVIVVATGAAARTNYLHGEKEFFGKGVSYDALSDGPAVAKRVVAVIGKSKHAAEESMILSRFAEKVHFVIPSNKLEADDSLLQQLSKNKTIELHFSTSLKRINGTDHANSITIFSNGQEKELPVAHIFTYIHEFQSSTSFLEKEVDLTQNGSIKVDNSLAASADGLFACGDVLCGRPQMPAISTAQGILAGASVDKYLSSKNRSENNV